MNLVPRQEKKTTSKKWSAQPAIDPRCLLKFKGKIDVLIDLWVPFLQHKTVTNMKLN